MEEPLYDAKEVSILKQGDGLLIFPSLFVSDFLG